MARTSMIAKYRRGSKFHVREHNRCRICGRPRGYLRRFDMCRICFRKLAGEGKIPGVIKSSW
ncbi:MAG TPA: type Z 30S ribosomal protein S14 [Spirochaetota bacterium]|nr:type Z 30S ribosomal protein S14 [Spirochaetota bacterium]HRZ25311.1 type Z 30S ribosomal protein S14 [Spirochaetota bacterium]HSA15400.1 type Z 30S ribosomal protein S14 [Spirochaetota bacterium]